MPANHLKSDLLLLATAMIWGFAFVAQRAGMSYVGPFTFNAIRFALGMAVLLPLAASGRSPQDTPASVSPSRGSAFQLFWGQIGLGVALFGGASLQQAGLVYTTAGKAGFITGLYVVMVPILGIALRQQTHLGTWLGAVLAVVGLYLLSVTKGFTIAFGDLLVVLSALLWAVHVHLISWLAPQMNVTLLAIKQYAICSLLSLVTALLVETIAWAAIWQAALPIFYGGVLSVGVAYTLQVLAQKEAHPSHAAILLSLEAVFAALGGWWLLNETLSGRGLIGCTLMLSGMLVSQLYGRVFRFRS